MLLVSVDRDVFVDGGKHRLSMHHYQATVERVYRGDWKVGEPIAFVQGFDYSTPTTTNRCAGERLVLMTQEHRNSEIGLDTGEVLRYERDFKNVLRCAFPEVERE